MTNSERTNLFLTTAIKLYVINVCEPCKPHPMRFVDVCTCYSKPSLATATIRERLLFLSAHLEVAASIREQ